MRLALGLLVLASCVYGVEPTVRDVSVRGLQIGGSTILTVDGNDFGTAPKLLLSVPIKQTLKKGTDKQATFEVTLDAKTPAGYANLQVATADGVSLPIVIALDRFKQHSLEQVVEQLPAACTGNLLNKDGAFVTFPCKAGQKVLVEVEAQRLGSKLRPVLHVTDPNNKQVAWSWGTPALQGDTRLEFTPPSDGAYVLQVHDAEYTTPNPNYFRVKIGQWSYIDQVFPPVLGKDTKHVELLGRSTHQVPALPDVPLAWPDNNLWSGPQPFAARSWHTEILEHAGKGQELPRGVVGVSGKLSAPDEEDVYRVPVSAGKIKFEVFAERLGSPLDVALVVRNEMGRDLARAEDSPGTLDPVLDYTVPEKVSFVHVVVVDASGRGGAKGVYRLTITPANAPKNSDFDLFTTAKRVPFAGTTVVPVYVERRGYAGPITVQGDNLPANFKLTNSVIPPEANGTLLVLDTPPGATANIVRLKGVADDKQERRVLVRGHPLEHVQPWLASEIPYATPAKTADFRVQWHAFPTEAVLHPVSKFALPITVQRGTDGPVRLTLLTSQSQVLANRQPDTTKMLRAEKPVELAPKVNDGVVDMLVPAELPSPVYDVVVQAELLTADKAKVLATSFTPVQRLKVVQPFTVRLTATNYTAKRDPKTGLTVEVTGEVQRSAAFKGEVALAVGGLPPGARINPTTVKAEATKFTVLLTLAANQPPGEVRSLTLSGSAGPDAKQPNARVKSVELPFIVQVPEVPKSDVPKK